MKSSLNINHQSINHELLLSEFRRMTLQEDCNIDVLVHFYLTAILRDDDVESYVPQSLLDKLSTVSYEIHEHLFNATVFEKIS